VKYSNLEVMPPLIEIIILAIFELRSCGQYNKNRQFKLGTGLDMVNYLSVQVSRISEAGLGRIPDEVKGVIRSTLALEPSVRPDALEITKVTIAHVGWVQRCS